MWYRAVESRKVRRLNVLIDLNRSRVRRYTNEDQQIDYPTDVGFEYVQSLQDFEIKWGR